MYRKVTQLRLEDFVFPYGKLDPENDWVKLASLVPWDEAEVEYAKQFVDNGHPAHPARIALGALIIKQRLKCSDEWTVRHVSENPYLQYFLGLKEYTSKCPFGASTMVEFRKRFSPQAIEALLAACAQEDRNSDDDSKGNSGTTGSSASKAENEPEKITNSGSLLMDATCCPADVAFPQDFQLLNQAREKLEKLIAEVCQTNGLSRPRMRRKQARRDYLLLSKSKKRSVKNIRSAVKKQLNYIFRDIGFITGFINKGMRLEAKQYDLLNTITTLYEQQLYMFEHKVHSVPDRIVSLSQPWIRPIVSVKSVCICS